MADVIQVYDEQLEVDGVRYDIWAYGEPQGHVWFGWLEFVPVAGGVCLRTPRETTQPNREALAYWASGLQPVYFEGAYQRAVRHGRTDAVSQLPAPDVIIRQAEDYLRHLGRGGSSDAA